MKTEHVLIIRFSALGDVAMTVPVVASLASQYPHVRFTVLSRGFAKAFFEDLAPNVGFMEADLKQEYRGVRGLNSLYRRLTAKHFTAIADLHNVLRSEYLRARFNLGRYKVQHINKHRLGKRRLVAASNKRLVQQPTSIQNYCDVFNKLGYPVTLTFKSIFGEGKGDLSLLPPSIGQKEARQLWLGIAPFAAHEGKIYPLPLMEEVIRQVTERRPDCRIFLFGGGEKEFETFAHWCNRFPQCTNASQQLHGLRQELILMSHLDLMLSMDSGNMHLASLTGTPVVSVWGATHPYAGFMGYNQNPDDAIQIDLPCRPCSIYGNKPCLRGDYACLQHITSDVIVQKLTAVYQRQQAAPGT